jgi:hypothetical protein
LSLSPKIRSVDATPGWAPQIVRAHRIAEVVLGEQDLRDAAPHGLERLVVQAHQPRLTRSSTGLDQRQIARPLG